VPFQGGGSETRDPHRLLVPPAVESSEADEVSAAAGAARLAAEAPSLRPGLPEDPPEGVGRSQKILSESSGERPPKAGSGMAGLLSRACRNLLHRKGGSGGNEQSEEKG